MFAKTLSALLLGLVALPSIAAARPAVRGADARPAATDRAARRTDAGHERSALAGPLKSLCERLECTADQLTAIRKVVLDTRERLAAERRDDRMVFAKMRAMHHGKPSADDKAMLKAAMAAERSQYQRLIDGGILGISNVLDDHQREVFLAMVEKIGAKAVLGAGGHAGKGKSFAARKHGSKRGDKPGKRSEMAHKRSEMAHKRSETAKKRGEMKRDGKTAELDRNAAKLERKAAKLERHSAKA